jgi:hypothetical protein
VANPAITQISAERKRGFNDMKPLREKKLTFDLSGVTAYLHQTSARWKVQRMHVP